MSIGIGTSTATFNAGSSSSISSSAIALTAGSMNLVAVRYATASQSGKQVFDTAGNRYLLICYRKDIITGGGTGLELWYCEDCLGNASNVVTVDFNAAVSNRSIAVLEVTGIASKFLFDSAASGHGAARTPTSGAFTVRNFGESLIAAAIQVNATGGTWTPGTSYTKAVEDGSGVLAIQYRVVTGQASGVTVDATSSAGSGESDIALAVFRDGTTVDARGGHTFFGGFA